MLCGKEQPENRPPEVLDPCTREFLPFPGRTWPIGTSTCVTMLLRHSKPAEQKEQRWKLSLVAHPHVMSRCEPAGVMGTFWESIAKSLGLAKVSLSNIGLWASGCGLDNTGRVCLWYSE